MTGQTEKTFKEKWLKAVEAKDSILCAGLDPAEYAMGRKEKGLPVGVKKYTWSRAYLEAVSPFCAAVKPNIQYWKGVGGSDAAGDADALGDLTGIAHDLGMVVIEDSKLADIGSTNDAGMFYAARKGADAVTYSPFAGNMEEAVEQAHARGLGLISMCLMSNPGFEREKNSWRSVERSQTYHDFDTSFLGNSDNDCHVPEYIQLAHDACKFGVDGIVIGAPSAGNHLSEEEIERAAYYYQEGLVLVPGVGAQGGDAKVLFKHFHPNHLIVNVGRSLMLPKGSKSTAKDQAGAAKQYRDMLNDLRG